MSEKYKPKDLTKTIQDIDSDNIHVRDIKNLIKWYFETENVMV